MTHKTDEERIREDLEKCGAYWIITKEDVGRELFVCPMGINVFKIKAKELSKHFISKEKVRELTTRMLSDMNECLAKEYHKRRIDEVLKGDK